MSPLAFRPYRDRLREQVRRTSRRGSPTRCPLRCRQLGLFRHEDDLERGFQRFEMKMDQGIWWADDAVQCLEKVLANPLRTWGNWCASRRVSTCG
jgi:hypothetical protein